MRKALHQSCNEVEEAENAVVRRPLDIETSSMLPSTSGILGFGRQIWAAALLLGVVILGHLSDTPISSIWGKSHSWSTMQHRRSLQTNNRMDRSKPVRVLYTITTLAEYDTGTRATQKGYDRMQHGLIPVMKEGVYSLLEAGFEVDVYIVAHFKMTREELLREALPSQVGLSVWGEASPYTYDPSKRDNPKAKLRVNTLGLARQHRFVVKEHLFNYDFFICLEDDMIVKGAHVQHHLQLTQQLYQLRQEAPETLDDTSSLKNPSGNLTKGQLQRMFPGYMRVEVLLDEAHYGTQKKLDPVPLAQPLVNVSVETCCVTEHATSPTRPSQPTSDQVFMWETGIQALGVRSLPPPLGVVALLRGPQYRQEEPNLTIADYWAGEADHGKTKYYEKQQKRPRPGDFAYINNQGGWMATRQQIWEWDTQVCLGGFLPPYDAPHFNFDGLDARNVEWWSGGMSLFTSRHACNMYRIVSLEDSKQFSNHLLYHSANNKQRQLAGKKDRFVKVDHLYAQLQTAKANFLKDYTPN